MARDDVVPLDRGWSLWRVAVLRGAGLPFEILDDLAMPALLAEPAGPERNEAIRAGCARQFDLLVRNDLLREAVAWQNPNIADTWLGHYADRLAGGGAPRLANRAYRESVLARYAQRYCAKNESIGFFGPVAWARLVDEQAGLHQSGGGGIRRRTAYLETWAVAALAGVFERTPGVFDTLTVRLDAATSVAGDQLRQPRRPAITCDEVTLGILAQVDGVRHVGAVLAEAAAVTGKDADQLRGELLRLRERGVVRIGFRVPHHHRPDLVLREQIERLPNPAVRDDLLARLDRVIAACAAAAAAGGPTAVGSALRDVSARFADAGCADADTPRHTLYGRTPVYLDCRRDTDVRVGPDLVGQLAAPLGLLLDSARWLTGEVADVVESELRRAYRWLRSRRGEVSLADLQFAAGEVLATGGPGVQEIRTDFQLRWAELIPATDGRLVQLSAARLRPMADKLFPRPASLRWAASRQHSPDLLLSRSPDGRTRWVLGELHVALNTAESRLFTAQCDDPRELVDATGRDMGRGRVVPVYPLDAAGATSRTYPPPSLDPPGRYRYWSYDGDDGRADGVRSVPSTAVSIHEVDGVLVGRADRDGWAAPVLEFFGEFLTAITVNLFQPRACAPRLPRVLLDDLVICRESWSVPADEVPVPAGPARDRGYQRVREWAAASGMPRHVFVKTPAERKPCYVDFEAPLLVGNFVRAVRRAARAAPGEQAAIDITEMLPAPDQLWLTDASGHRYTSEFRVVAVDELETGTVISRVAGDASGESQVPHDRSC
ncbi:lantibiotic dehydratase [Rugosimonospora africana]|uniref:Lantibiotic dehydratase n=1 Tax=Rugosimonospora africana TaxID=556532 RepID=A0A8J3VVD8_9ACTN|nr:lantibiotic dehydratase [Rugosimonospora africana]GIH19618.1 lantibiotic dehydratase [Rugosimonospora africana]